jgi:hypothetical protein
VEARPASVDGGPGRRQALAPGRGASRRRTGGAGRSQDELEVPFVGRPRIPERRLEEGMAEQHRAARRGQRRYLAEVPGVGMAQEDAAQRLGPQALLGEAAPEVRLGERARRTRVDEGRRGARQQEDVDGGAGLSADGQGDGDRSGDGLPDRHAG